MDYRLRLWNLCTRIATKDPNPAGVASELATLAGLVAHEAAEDECEREHAEETLVDQFRVALRFGKG